MNKAISLKNGFANHDNIVSMVICQIDDTVLQINH